MRVDATSAVYPSSGRGPVGPIPFSDYLRARNEAEARAERLARPDLVDLTAASTAPAEAAEGSFVETNAAPAPCERPSATPDATTDRNAERGPGVYDRTLTRVRIQSPAGRFFDLLA